MSMKKAMNSLNHSEMASQSTSLGLLEVLQFRTGCTYLSDLRKALNLPLIPHVLGEFYSRTTAFGRGRML